MATYDSVKIYSKEDGANVLGSYMTLEHNTSSQEGADLQDLALGAGPPGTGGSRPITGLFTSPYGTTLTIDSRPANSYTPFEISLQAFNGSLSLSNNWLETIYAIGPTETHPDARLDVSIWGTNAPSNPYFTQTTYASQTNRTDSWSLTAIPNGHVYGKATWTPLDAVIPEPGTMGLLAFGLGVAYATKKMKKAVGKVRSAFSSKSLEGKLE